MKNYLKWTGMALLAVASLACQDDINDPDLPRATQFGANTIGFKVNGKNWVPRNVSDREVVMGISTHSKVLTIHCNRQIEDVYQSLTLNLANVVEEIDYYNIIADKYNITYTNSSFQSSSFSVDLNQEGSIHITKLDTANKIVSGQFYFTVINPSGQSLEITDGRFDFKYPYSR